MKHDSARKTAVEGAAQAVFSLCGCFSVFAVIFITLYMMVGGVPAVFKVGIKEILFRSVWEPVAAEPKYGILYIILTSVIGTGLAVMLGAPVGILTAVFLAEMADFAAFNAVYEKYFTEKPARSCVAVKQLPKDVLCEVEVTAYLK